MKSTQTPWTHIGVTAEEITTEFGPSGRMILHEVTVPQGTACRKLVGGSTDTWVVADLRFIEDKRSFMYSDADIYGIRIPEEKITGITPVKK